MKQTIQFINMTTRLPVNKDVVNFFFEKFSSKVLDGCGRFYDLSVPVYCVSKNELDFYRNMILRKPDDPVDQYIEDREREKKIEEFSENEQKFNPDLLGVFIPMPKAYGCRPVIMVSPEKIMEAAYLTKNEEAMMDKTLYEIYQILFTKVVLHELGHWSMFDHKPDCRVSVKWIADGLDEDDDKQRYLKILSTEKNGNCNKKSEWTRNYGWGKLIEESLANRFVLMHNWDDSEKELIWKFISKQPQEYAAAISWKDTKSIRDTICSWRWLKKNNRIGETLKKYDPNHTFLKNLVKKLNDKEKVDSFHFKKEWIKFTKTRIDKWLKKPDPLLWDTFGILYDLIEYEKVKDPNKAIEFAEERLSLVGTDDERADVWLCIAEIYESISDSNNYLLALKEALKFSEKTKGYHQNNRTEKILKALN